MRPSWLSVRWPLLLLLASLTFTALGVIEANRAIRSQRTVAAHALQDYAGFVSWSYQQHLRELLGGATQEILGAVNHGEGMHQDPRVPSARDLPHYLPWNAHCACHRPMHGPSPAIYFAYVLGSDTLGYAINTHPDPAEGWEVDRPLPASAGTGRVMGYDADERRWINDTLTKQIRHGSPDAARFPVVVATHDSVPRLLAYTLMPTSWGDTLVYGAEYSRAAFTGFLADVMYDRNLLPATFTRGHAVNEVVQLRVSDARDNTLFESEPVREWMYDDTTRLPPAFGSLRVHAQIRPALAGNLVIGGLPKSRLPFLLGLLAVAAALGIVAFGQIRREGELARLRENFVANISHELRTPLAQMRLYLETLRLGRFKTDDQRAWSLDNVERETTRLTELVERVLRFSRTGRQDDDAREKIDVATEVQRIVDEFQPLAAARGARVLLNTVPVAPLLLRPAAMRHLVLNMLDNAVKYGPAGQTIRVRVHQADGAVRIEVADEGPGIAPSERTRLWKPYQRGRSAGHTAGSGIGLAVVHDVALAHGGRAWIADPADGVGALFIVSLPVAADAPTPAPGRDSSLAAVSPPSLTVRG